MICDYEGRLKQFHDGKDVQLIRLTTKRNVFNGLIVRACKGCRASMNGGWKYLNKVR
jgi:hypothetical protein